MSDAGQGARGCRKRRCHCSDDHGLKRRDITDLDKPELYTYVVSLGHRGSIEILYRNKSDGNQDTYARIQFIFGLGFPG